MTCLQPSKNKNKFAYKAPRYYKSLRKHRVALQAQPSPSHVVVDARHHDPQQECLLRALRIANENASLFTTALTAKYLYKSGKYNNDALHKILNKTARALKVAQYEYNTRVNSFETRMSSSCYETAIVAAVDVDEEGDSNAQQQQGLELATCA